MPAPRVPWRVTLETPMPKLTKIQRLFLSTAAAREPALLMPFPEEFAEGKMAASRLARGLLKDGLCTEQPGEPGQPVWRQKKGRPQTLILTAAGKRAAVAKAELKPTKTQLLPADRQAAKKGTKLKLLTDLLRRKGGATINEASKATGWLPHSVRGAISGALKKRLQLAVLSESIDGRGRVYRIAR